ADLVLLDANPLEDIGNTRTADAVVLGGRLIPRPVLDSLLTQAEKNRWRANPAGLILIGLILSRMRRVLLAGLAGIVILTAGIYHLRKRRRVARGVRAESPQ